MLKVFNSSKSKHLDAIIIFILVPAIPRSYGLVLGGFSHKALGASFRLMSYRYVVLASSLDVALKSRTRFLGGAVAQSLLWESSTDKQQFLEDAAAQCSKDILSTEPFSVGASLAQSVSGEIFRISPKQFQGGNGTTRKAESAKGEQCVIKTARPGKCFGKYEVDIATKLGFLRGIDLPKHIMVMKSGGMPLTWLTRKSYQFEMGWIPKLPLVSLSSNQLHTIFFDCVEALRGFHQLGFLHRDISANNVTFMGNLANLTSPGKVENSTVHLIDFGSAAKTPTGIFGTDKSTRGGTTKGYYLESFSSVFSDIFSLGRLMETILEKDSSLMPIVTLMCSKEWRHRPSLELVRVAVLTQIFHSDSDLVQSLKAHGCVVETAIEAREIYEKLSSVQGCFAAEYALAYSILRDLLGPDKPFSDIDLHISTNGPQLYIDLSSLSKPPKALDQLELFKQMKKQGLSQAHIEKALDSVDLFQHMLAIGLDWVFVEKALDNLEFFPYLKDKGLEEAQIALALVKFEKNGLAEVSLRFYMHMRKALIEQNKFYVGGATILPQADDGVGGLLTTTKNIFCQLTDSSDQCLVSQKRPSEITFASMHSFVQQGWSQDSGRAEAVSIQLTGDPSIRMAFGCVDALMRTHAEGWLHGDVNPQNMFFLGALGQPAELGVLLEKGTIGIVPDMGFVTLSTPGPGAPQKHPGSPFKYYEEFVQRQGTKAYCAPEILEHQSSPQQFSELSDIFALGMLLRVCLPFDSKLVGIITQMSSSRRRERPPLEIVRVAILTQLFKSDSALKTALKRYDCVVKNPARARAIFTVLNNPTEASTYALAYNILRGWSCSYSEPSGQFDGLIVEHGTRRYIDIYELISTQSQTGKESVFRMAYKNLELYGQMLKLGLNKTEIIAGLSKPELFQKMVKLGLSKKMILEAWKTPDLFELIINYSLSNLNAQTVLVMASTHQNVAQVIIFLELFRCLRQKIQEETFVLKGDRHMLRTLILGKLVPSGLSQIWFSMATVHGEIRVGLDPAEILTTAKKIATSRRRSEAPWAAWGFSRDESTREHYRDISVIVGKDSPSMG